MAQIGCLFYSKHSLCGQVLWFIYSKNSFWEQIGSSFCFTQSVVQLFFLRILADFLFNYLWIQLILKQTLTSQEAAKSPKNKVWGFLATILSTDAHMVLLNIEKTGVLPTFSLCMAPTFSRSIRLPESLARIFPERLDLLTSVFVLQFRLITGTYKINFDNWLVLRFLSGVPWSQICFTLRKIFMFWKVIIFFLCNMTLNKLLLSKKYYQLLLWNTMKEAKCYPNHWIKNHVMTSTFERNL